MDYREAYAKLQEYGQEHVLKYYEELSEEEKQILLKQVEQTDFSILNAVAEGKKEPVRGKITPLAAMQLKEIRENEEHFREVGQKAIREGKVGAVLLAGGMGTRLGSDNPKGMFNIGLTKEVYIFQRLIENLMDVVRETGVYIPLYVMTSDKNHEATTAFLAEHNYFGYDRNYISFFMQDMAPATDYHGKIYLEKKFKMSTSPNGNGGWYISMHRSGIAQKAQEAGVEWLNIFSVDNVLQRIADPVFVGAVIEGNVVSGAKVVKKCAPDEKVGVMCLEDGHPSIVEYYDLTQELMDAKDDAGEPAYNFGVILNYLFKISELEKIREKNLPLHVVEKKILYMNEQGVLVKPESPNGYKFESLVLDMIYEMENCLPFEVERNREFAPIKNATGVDSVESARKLCQENGIEL